MKLEDGCIFQRNMYLLCFHIRKSLQCGNAISDASEVRLQTWGKASVIITQFVVGGHVVMQALISEINSLIYQVHFN